MRVVVQRCENASVTVENKKVGHIKKAFAYSLDLPIQITNKF